jgi:hypothetical protein
LLNLLSFLSLIPFYFSCFLNKVFRHPVAHVHGVRRGGNGNIFATAEQAEASIALAMLSQQVADCNGLIPFYFSCFLNKVFRHP